MLDCSKVTEQLNLFFVLHCLFLFLIHCLCQSDCSVFAGVPHGALPDAGLSVRHTVASWIFSYIKLYFSCTQTPVLPRSCSSSCSCGFLFPTFVCSWEHKGLSDTAHTMSVSVAGQEVIQQGSHRKVNASPNEVKLMALMQWNSCSGLFRSSQSQWDQIQRIAALFSSHTIIMIDLQKM